MVKIDAVILAAGAGRRMKEFGIPKALILVGGKPMICYAIDALRACGLNSIFIIKYYSDMFDVVDEIYKNTDLSIQYINDYKRKGSLYSFSLVEKYVGEKFICLDCDLYIVPSFFKKMVEIGLKTIEERVLDGTIAYVRNSIKEDSNMLLIENDFVVRFLKDNNPLCKRGGYVFLWDKVIFETVEFFFSKGCYSLSEYYDFFAQRHRIGIMEIEDIWDIDNKSDVLFTNSYLERIKQRSENPYYRRNRCN